MKRQPVLCAAYRTRYNAIGRALGGVIGALDIDEAAWARVKFTPCHVCHGGSKYHFLANERSVQQNGARERRRIAMTTLIAPCIHADTYSHCALRHSGIRSGNVSPSSRYHARGHAQPYCDQTHVYNQATDEIEQNAEISRVIISRWNCLFVFLN